GSLVVSRTPPVALTIALAWLLASRAPTLIAITRMPAVARSLITDACVTEGPPSGPVGSWLGASPIQTMILLESVRQPTLLSVASSCRPQKSASGMSRPQPACQPPAAFATAVVSEVTAWSSLYAYGQSPAKSLYSAT